MTESKETRNARVQDRYDELMREGRHGHYETLFRIVREELVRATLAEQPAMRHGNATIVQADGSVLAVPKVAEQPAAPVVLTDAEIDSIMQATGIAPPNIELLHPMKRLGYQTFARAILAAAIPPGHCVVKDEPVAWVEAVNTYEGPYNFHGKSLLTVGKHDLYAKVSAARPGEEV